MGQAYNLSISEPNCSDSPYSVQFTWQGQGDYWVNISDRADFAGWAQKYVGGSTFTNCPFGFSENAQLLPEVTYYWRVFDVQTGTHSYGGSWRIQRCDQYDTFPAGGLNAQPIPDGNFFRVNFGWGPAVPVSDIQSQYLDFGTNPNFPDGTYFGIPLASGVSTHTIGELPPGTTWYWRVTALDRFGRWLISNTATLVIPGVSQPPSGCTPADDFRFNGFSPDTGVATFSWTPAVNPEASFLDLSTQSGWIDGTYQSINIKNNNGFLYSLGGLALGTRYYVRLTTLCNGQWIVKSDVNFQTGTITPPGSGTGSGPGGTSAPFPHPAPTGPLPISASAGVYNPSSRTDTCDFSWQRATGSGQVVSQFVDISTDSNFPAGSVYAVDVGNNASSAQIPGILPGIQQYWRVAILWQWADATQNWFHSSTAGWTPVAAPEVPVGTAPDDYPYGIDALARDLVGTFYASLSARSGWGPTAARQRCAEFLAIGRRESGYNYLKGAVHTIDVRAGHALALDYMHCGVNQSSAKGIVGSGFVAFGPFQLDYTLFYSNYNSPGNSVENCNFAQHCMTPSGQMSRMYQKSDGGTHTIPWGAPPAPNAAEYAAIDRAIGSSGGTVSQSAGTDPNQAVLNPIYTPRQDTPVGDGPGATRVS